MIDRGFFYRRLARLFPVYLFAFARPGGVVLANKHQVAGFSEVFILTSS